ncbi:N-formimino-L-glutamate deiminase [compost metagenome]
MQLDRQTVSLCSTEHLPHLISRKSDAFTETINRISQAFRHYRGHHLVDDFCDISCLVIFEFRWHGVSAEKCCADCNVPFFTQSPRGA